MRKIVLRIVGGICIAIGLLGMAQSSTEGLFTSGVSYNIFYLVIGMLSFGAADLGSEFGQWFDFMFGILLVIICLGSVASWLYGSGDVHAGTIFFTGIAAVAVLYLGHELPEQLKKGK